MTSFIRAIFLLVAVLAVQITALNVPKPLNKLRCTKSTPDFNKCLLRSIEEAKPYLMRGIPELGVPPLDPLEIESVSVDRTLNQLVKLNAKCSNIKITGFRNTVIKSLKFDPETYQSEVRVTIPWMYLEMDYDVKGQLLVVPLESKGHFVGNFTDTHWVIKSARSTYLKDGVEYMKIDKLSQKFTIGSGEVKLTAQDKDFQYAADLINDFFNNNPRQVLDAVNPIFVELSNAYFKDLINVILARMPRSVWIPDE